MPAEITIDQAGLPAGTAGESRSDGLDTGALVTLTSSGGGATHLVEFLWVPDLDTGAISSLVQTATPSVWTFTPTSGVFGTYRIRLTIDLGLPTEDVSIRLFSIRTPNTSLRIPAMNERCDPRASLLLATAAEIAASEDNEPEAGGPFAAGNYGGWYRSLRELYEAVEGGAGGQAALFNWNGVDTTQFGSNLLAPTAGTITLTVDTSNPEQNYLSLNLAAFQGHAVFPVTVAALATLARYVVRWRLADSIAILTTDRPRLVLFSNLASGASYRGLEIDRRFNNVQADLAQEESTTEIAIQTGTLANFNSPNRRRGVVEEYQVVCENPVSTDPDVIIHGECIGSIMQADAWDTGGLGAFTGWDTLVASGVGIGVRVDGVALTGSILIAELGVFQHMADV